jgi:methyl-accepting chemotaxis protein/ABC-type phosphate transport system substrate-binding protein
MKRRRFVSRNLTAKLTTWISLIGLVPLLFFGYLSSLERAITLRIIACLAPAVIIAALLLARKVAKPIGDIAQATVKLSKGDLTTEFPSIDAKDELGVLGQAIELVAENLRDQTHRILDGVDVLGKSSSEIFIAVSQVAATASQSSEAVSESTQAMNELGEAAKVSSEKARKVADAAQQAVVVSQSGREFTEGTIKRMELIRAQMNSVGESIEQLNEHSQAIELIVNAVQDLADQSNLLAVNASIEAARAGEHGKGFSVVAHEIKSLADQSKNATRKVRSLLNDTREATQVVVKSSREVYESVATGASESQKAGESISALADSVEASAQAASVIQASSEQQFAGVGHARNAMQNIQEAVRQNNAGIAQLEEAAGKLVALGGHLKELVDQYTIERSTRMSAYYQVSPTEKERVLRISGAGLLTGLTEGFLNRYLATIPEYKGVVIPATAGKGFTAFIQGDTDLVMATRRMTVEETSEVRSSGMKPDSKLLGKICLAVIVNSDNPLDFMSMEQVRRVFVGDVTNWRDLGGPDRKILVTTMAVPETGSGVVFQHTALKGADYAPGHIVLRNFGSTVTFCENNSGAIGYIPTSTAYFRDAKNRHIKVLAISADETGQGAVSPQQGVSKDTPYPVTIPYYMFWDGKSSKKDLLQGLADFAAEQVT